MKKTLLILILVLAPSWTVSAVAGPDGAPDGERLDRRPSTWNNTQAQTFSLRVTDMDCQGCETRVQNAIRKVPGVRSVSADSDTGEVRFTIDGRNKVDETAVVRAVENEGFRVLR